MSIPLPIATERLLLRTFEPGDVPAMATVYGDPTVMRHIVGLGLLDREQTAELLRRYTASQHARGYSTWAVVEKSSGRTVGDAGFEIFKPTGEPELGYTLAADVWGRGYATEAARACIDAAFEHLSVPRIVAKVDARNDRSLRVAERLGMRRVGTIEMEGRPHTLLALER